VVAESKGCRWWQVHCRRVVSDYGLALMVTTMSHYQVRIWGGGLPSTAVE
jgi:hypothetical protein